MLPVNFRRKLGEVEPYLFVIKNDIFEQCLELYTMEKWEETINKIQQRINPFDQEDKQVIRDFRMGATEVECDPSGRILIPGRLLKQADIKSDTVLSGGEGVIEIWASELFGKSGGDIAAKRDRFARILGNSKTANI
jgi:MraZ protein